MKDKKGVKHILAHEVLKCWENHFKEHLNTELTRDSAAINNINIPHNDQSHVHHCAGKAKSRKIQACPCSQLKDMGKNPLEKLCGQKFSKGLLGYAVKSK